MPKAEELAQQYTKDQVWKKFDALPERVRDTILAPKNLEQIYFIAKENNILDKAEYLVRYVDLVLLGIVPITLLRETLEEELRIDEARARKIAMEIRDKIFMQAKDELQKIHGLG
ncbi:MAG: hypothetical protein WAP23_01240 [Candidatus Spechtbacterales bacterium]